jgi:sec-independent protein translocase protein TatA
VPLVIIYIVLVKYAPKRLPELAEAMGKSIRKFKEASRDVKEEVTSAVTKEETKP